MNAIPAMSLDEIEQVINAATETSSTVQPASADLSAFRAPEPPAGDTTSIEAELREILGTPSATPAEPAPQQPVPEAQPELAQPVSEAPVESEQPAASTDESPAEPQPAQTGQSLIEAIASEVAADEQAAGSAAPAPLMSDDEVTALGEFLHGAIKKMIDAGNIASYSEHPTMSAPPASWTADSFRKAIIFFNKGTGSTVAVPGVDEEALAFAPYFERAIAITVGMFTGKTARPKAAKKVAGEKARKQPAEKKQPERVAAEVFKIALANVALPEERTAKVVLPTWLFLDADPAKITKRKGHQIDPSRAASCMPVMPNALLMDDTGNPYPNDPAHPTIVTFGDWAKYVKIGHAVFELLKEQSEVKARDGKFIGEVLKRAGLPQDIKYAEASVVDALRDLACCGYAVQFLEGRTRIFRIAEE